MKKADYSGRGPAVRAWLLTMALSLAFVFGLTSVAAASPPMSKWVDKLPVPPVATPTFKPFYSLWADYYEINMSASEHQFNSSLGDATVWTYGQPGRDPVLLGPTIVATTGRPVVVKYINNLPTDPNAFPLKDSIDSTLMGFDVPTGAAIPHLHGGHTAARFDGTPMQWWTAPDDMGVVKKGPDFVTKTFTYMNDQPAALLWYHDHTWGSTRFKPYLGLAAAYLLFDKVDNGSTITVNGPDRDRFGKLIKHVQKVPSGDYHLPLVLQDKEFNADDPATTDVNENGTLFYPTEGISPTHPVWVPEFFGDTPVINGKAYPYLDAQPRRYRLRLLNGSQARFYDLHFHQEGGSDLPFWVIGSEQGLLPKPAEKTHLVIAPGERYDVIVDFYGAAGSTVYMTNDANEPYPGGDPPAVTDLIKINVSGSDGVSDDTVDPADLKLPAVARLANTPGVAPRDIVLKETMTTVGEGEEAEEVPTEVLLNGYHFTEPTTDIIKAGTTETWRWINLTVDAHPMHPHLVASQVVKRQAFRVEDYKRAWDAYVASDRGSGRNPLLKPDVTTYLTGIPEYPEDPGPEMGFKDTVQAPPGYVTWTRAKFNLPATSLLDFNWRTGSFGSWVYHCHILEHEENDMMRPFEVVK